MAQSGILVLDNNCYALLEDVIALHRFRANLQVADLVAAPSELNLLEAIGTRPLSVQQRLLRTMKTVLADRPLLAWPYDVLRQTAEALLRGESKVEITFTGKEWYLDDPTAAAQIQAAALETSNDMERQFDEMHDRARVRVRAEMKKRGWVDSWEEIRAFLDQHWRSSDMPAFFAEAYWRGLKLPGVAPTATLLDIPAWRLMTDADGVAVYARALAHEQPKKVHRKDLIQLIYLAGGSRRIIATADAAFLDAATAVLAGHANARAVHIRAMLQ